MKKIYVICLNILSNIFNIVLSCAVLNVKMDSMMCFQHYQWNLVKSCVNITYSLIPSRMSCLVMQIRQYSRVFLSYYVLSINLQRMFITLRKLELEHLYNFIRESNLFPTLVRRFFRAIYLFCKVYCESNPYFIFKISNLFTTLVSTFTKYLLPTYTEML